MNAENVGVDRFQGAGLASFW